MNTLVLLLVLSLGTPTAPKRLRAVIRAYLIETGFPNGRPGYVVDHLIPLCAGGRDHASNLQWQERRASYRKDVFERQLCEEMKRQQLTLVKRK